MHDVSLAEIISGGSSPPKFLDASVLDHKEEFTQLREVVKQQCIKFEFPSGLASVDIFEQCRALCDLENFDVMYDLTMQFLSGKDLAVKLKNRDGSETVLGEAHITDKYMDMRGIQCIADYPWIINWLTEFMAAYLGKQFPMPLSVPAAASETTSGKSTEEKPKRLS